MLCHVPHSSRRNPRRPSRFEMEISRFAQLMAEVLAGERIAEHLRPLLSQSAYDLLRRRAGIYASLYRPHLQRTLLRPVESDVTEVSAVVGCGPRIRALALRVAVVQQSWLCTHFETDADCRYQ